MMLMAAGHNNPAMVPIPFEMPISMLAYLGAISKWFTLNPEKIRDTLLKSSDGGGRIRNLPKKEIKMVNGLMKLKNFSVSGSQFTWVRPSWMNKTIAKNENIDSRDAIPGTPTI